MSWLLRKTILSNPFLINIKKISIAEGDDYTIGCLLDYVYLKENYKIVAIDLSKQQVFDAVLKVIQQINFTANLDGPWDTNVFNYWRSKTILDISKWTVRVL